jgi:hypothetical protein
MQYHMVQDPDMEELDMEVEQEDSNCMECIHYN